MTGLVATDLIADVAPGAVSAPGHARPVTPLGIIAARLVEVAELLDHACEATYLDPRIRAGVAQALDLAAGLDPYLEANSGAESPALRALAERTAAHDWTTHGGLDADLLDSPVAPLEQEMLSGHVEGRFLQMLARATRARRVLEIGMFTGYSALALAEALGDGGRVVACEIDPEVSALAQDCFAASPAGERIEVRVGPARNTLSRLADDGEQFDLVFLDADKAGYADYLRLLLDRDLLAGGGLVCVDNTLMQGQPWTSGDRSVNGRAVADFNRAVTDDPRLEQVVVPLRDGLTLIRRAGD